MDSWKTVHLYNNIQVGTIDGILHSNHPIGKKSAYFLKYIDIICSFLSGDKQLTGVTFKLIFAGGSVRALMDNTVIRDVDIYFGGEISQIDLIKEKLSSLPSDQGFRSKYFLTVTQNDFSLALYNHRADPIPNNGDMLQRNYSLYSFFPVIGSLFSHTLLPFQIIDYEVSPTKYHKHFRPQSLSDIISGFDFINCAAGVSFTIKLPDKVSSKAIIEVDEISEHPLFGISLATKELLVNTSSSLLPRLSLVRLLKYIGYGYKVDPDNIDNMCSIARLMGVSNDAISETILAGPLSSC